MHKLFMLSHRTEANLKEPYLQQQKACVFSLFNVSAKRSLFEVQGSRFLLEDDHIGKNNET